METKNERALAAVRASDNLVVTCIDGDVRINRELVRQNIMVLGAALTAESSSLSLSDTTYATFSYVKHWLINDDLPLDICNRQLVLAFAFKYDCQPLVDQLTRCLSAQVVGNIDGLIAVINSFGMENKWEVPILTAAYDQAREYMRHMSLAHVCSAQPLRSCCVHNRSTNIIHFNHLNCCYPVTGLVQHNSTELQKYVKKIANSVPHTVFAAIASGL